MSSEGVYFDGSGILGIKNETMFEAVPCPELPRAIEGTFLENYIISFDNFSNISGFINSEIFDFKGSFWLNFCLFSLFISRLYSLAFLCLE